jgi:hypothetical protein
VRLLERVRELRQLLNQLLMAKLEEPAMELLSYPVVKAAIAAIAAITSSRGHACITPPRDCRVVSYY